jgi:hypothetical protein
MQEGSQSEESYYKSPSAATNPNPWSPELVERAPHFLYGFLSSVQFQIASYSVYVNSVLIGFKMVKMLSSLVIATGKLH